VLERSGKLYTLLLRPGGLEDSGIEKLQQQLNVYELGAVLGTGMCGEVFQATHKMTGAQVALKRLKQAHFEQVRF
jgi:hypothetical protein